jgi:hypothetical protein
MTKVHAHAFYKGLNACAAQAAQANQAQQGPTARNSPYTPRQARLLNPAVQAPAGPAAQAEASAAASTHQLLRALLQLTGLAVLIAGLCWPVAWQPAELIALLQFVLLQQLCWAVCLMLTVCLAAAAVVERQLCRGPDRGTQGWPARRQGPRAAAQGLLVTPAAWTTQHFL